MLEYDEKRNFIRMEADCRVAYRPAGGDTFSEGRCVNISGSGVLFSAAEPFEVGQALEIMVTPENKITPPLRAYIEVLRCEPSERGYDIGGVIKVIKSE